MKISIQTSLILYSSAGNGIQVTDINNVCTIKQQIKKDQTADQSGYDLKARSIWCLMIIVRSYPAYSCSALATYPAAFDLPACGIECEKSDKLLLNGWLTTDQFEAEFQFVL